MKFTNQDLIRIALRKVEGDYDVCLIDCAPGVLLHDNIFKALIFLLMPNFLTSFGHCNDIVRGA